MQQDLLEVYDKATSSQVFFKFLKEKGHELYKRNGQLVGVVKKRKYRFKTLGYSKEKIQLLDRNLKKENRLKQIKRLRNNHSRDVGREQ